MRSTDEAWARLYEFRYREDEANHRRKARFELYLAPALVFLTGLATAIMVLTQRLYGEAETWADAIFAAFQVFLLNSSADPNISPGAALWFYDLGRFLAVGVFLYVGASLLVNITRSAWDSIRLLGLSGHVIVVGLGRKGFQLATELGKAGDKVVVLELDPDHPRAAAARADGAIVLQDDGRSALALRKARVRRAAAVVCVTSDDEQNLEVAMACERQLALPTDSPKATVGFNIQDGLERWLDRLDLWAVGGRAKLAAILRESFAWGSGPPIASHADSVCEVIVEVRDLELKQALERRAPAGLLPGHGSEAVVSSTSGDRTMELRIFNACENSARNLFWQYPLDVIGRAADDPPIDADSDFSPHIVVIGLGDMGESVMLQAARTCVLPNYRNHKLRVSVFDAGARKAVANLRSRIPAIKDAIDLDAHDCEPGLGRATANIIQKWIKGSPARGNTSEKPPQHVTAIYVCVPGDAASFRIADWLSIELGPDCPPVFFRMEDSGGLAAIGRSDDADDASIQAENRVPFGFVQLSCSSAAILDAKADLSARAFHQIYQEVSGGDEVWSEISLALKQSNRDAVDHMPVKVRCAGLAVREGNGPGDPVPEDKIDMLAELEHQRFCVERWCAGWTATKKTEKSRLRNENLVPWSKVDGDRLTGTRSYDYKPVEALPKLLARVGLVLAGDD